MINKFKIGKLHIYELDDQIRICDGSNQWIYKDKQMSRVVCIPVMEIEKAGVDDV